MDATASRRNRRPRRGFSLIEVVIAVGLFAFALVVIFGLLSTFTRSSSNSSDTLTAVALPDAVRLEMKRQMGMSGYANLASAVRTASGGYVMVADRMGGRLHARDANLPPGPELISPSEQYFQVTLNPFNTGPLAYSDAKPYFAVTVFVSWPYRLPAATQAGYAETPPESRESVSFNVVLSR